MVGRLRCLVVTLFLVLPLTLLSGQTAQAVDGGYLSIDRYSEPLTGKFLVASPDMKDPHFHHTVIYIVHHDVTGAMGVVINRLMAKGPVDKLFKAFGIQGAPQDQTPVKMYYGGPVDPGSSLILHRSDYSNESTTEIGNHLAVSASDNVLADLAMNKGPHESLLILGYAGWGSTQLDDEITSGAWYVVKADDALLFDDDLATKWKRALALRGFEL